VHVASSLYTWHPVCACRIKFAYVASSLLMTVAWFVHVPSAIYSCASRHLGLCMSCLVVHTCRIYLWRLHFSSLVSVFKIFKVRKFENLEVREPLETMIYEDDAMDSGLTSSLASLFKIFKILKLENLKFGSLGKNLDYNL
jgi:hypothetical protein